MIAWPDRLACIFRISTIFRSEQPLRTLYPFTCRGSAANPGIKDLPMPPSVDHPATILVVDDKPANIKLLFDSLKNTGYRTLAALDGESAVRQAELALPDLILMDVMMPGMDGFEACRRLKDNPATRHIPVLFMTALTETADKLKGFQAGGVDYLTKPLQHEEVLARISAQMIRHRLWADVEIYSKVLLAMGGASSPDAVWTALDELALRQKDVAGVAVWLEDTGWLKLEHVRGFPAGNPATWRHNSDRYDLIPASEQLLGRAFREKRQISALNRKEWPSYPAWAGSGRFHGYIVSPICCREACHGVLAVFFNAPLLEFSEERRRWHQIVSNSLGNALSQARSLEDIRRLSDQLSRENAVLREEVGVSGAPGGMIGTSSALRRVLEQVDLVAATDAAVLVLGESGTGKELLAQAIHERSRRAALPLIRVNCAAIPHELFESEFFGHVKGSFTGAIKDRAGRFALADKGTLFLDEIGEIPMELQGKLLRVLQEGTFERVGDEKMHHANVRIIAATNRDLHQAVQEGRFRQDLFYRLSVFPVVLPPLRERSEDIPDLCRHFVALAARKMGVPPPPVRDDQLGAFLDYPWPGNIRELQNEIERTMILSKGRQPEFAAPNQARAHPFPPTASVLEHGGSRDDSIIQEQDWGALQRKNMLRALKRTKWRVDSPGGAADLLGLRPTTLRSRMKAMGIERPV
jgi:DNA-binding NtrC family response regulator